MSSRYSLGRQSFHAVHRGNHGFGIGGIAIGIGEVRRMNGKLDSFLKVPAAEPDAGCDETAIDNGIVRRGILDPPAVINGPENLIRTACLNRPSQITMSRHLRYGESGWISVAALRTIARCPSPQRRN